MTDDTLTWMLIQGTLQRPLRMFPQGIGYTNNWWLASWSVLARDFHTTQWVRISPYKPFLEQQLVNGNKRDSHPMQWVCISPYNFFLGQPPVNQDIFLLYPHFCSFPYLNICRLRLYMLELGVKNLLRALNKPEVQYYWSQLLRYSCWMNDAKLWQDSPVKEPIRQRERRQQWVVTQPHSPQHTHKIGGFSRKESIPAGKKHATFFATSTVTT